MPARRKRSSSPTNSKRPPGASVRLRDVAKLARVSSATVSRVMNAPELVSDTVIERVRAAAASLGYVPNNAARALRSRRTHIIGTVIPTLDHAIYAQQVEALQRELSQHGYLLLVTASEYNLLTELTQVRLLIERGIEGLVLVGENHDPRLFELLSARRIEYITTYCYNPRGTMPCVGFDNRRTIARVADYLLDLGHVDICMLAGITKDNDRAFERVEGFKAALAARGLSPGPIIEKPYLIAAGREAFRTLVARGLRSTAVICASDVLAFGVLAECAAQGIRIPMDLSVVGFDNLAFAAHLQPSLTTVQVPASEMGRRAGDYLIRRLRGEQAESRLEVEASLIIRETTAAAPRHGRAPTLHASTPTEAHE